MPKDLKKQDLPQTYRTLLHRFCVTSLTIDEWKGDLIMAYPAVFTAGYLHHRVFDRAFFRARKYIRMADLASVPEGMLLMGEEDIGHPCTP